MPDYKQAGRALRLTTPLGPDALLLTAVSGREAISQLFDIRLECAAERQTNVSFDALLGQNVTVEIEPLLVTGMPVPYTPAIRSLNGMVKKVAQGERTEEFTNYHLTIVPRFWLLTRKVQSRIFQQKSVPDILAEVLTGLDVDYEIQGTFHPREYCVQYRESDFNFACRLMEEEGIYYFFKHSGGGHTMVLANTPQSHPDLPFTSTVTWEEFGGHGPQYDRVYGWNKGQEIRSGKYTVWDEHFELFGKHLDAQKSIQGSVAVGRTSHNLTAGGGGSLEQYEFPGEYSRHFDAIDKGGAESQKDHLQWPFDDNQETAKIRIEQEAADALVIEGNSAHPGFTAGHQFNLDGHFSDNGEFVVTSVRHDGKQPIGVQGGETPYEYENYFTAIPSALPYRPPRATPIPSVRGVQLATVVGPPGEEIFTDKYGRVKVQFHWDREGKMDAGSSCWLRVGTFWAGPKWGAIHIPRIGHEVVVAFEEGDVDHPIIVGSVYNCDNMPPYKLPDKKTVSTVKSRSTLKGEPANYNELRFEDFKGKEQVFFHAERDKDERVKHDSRERVIHDRHLIVGWEKDGETGGDQKEKVFKDKHGTIEGNHLEETGGDHHVHTKGNVIEKTDGNNDYTLGGNHTEQIGGNNQIAVGGAQAETIGGKLSITVGQSTEQKSGTKFAHAAGQEIHLQAGMTVVIEAGAQLTLKGPGGFISIGSTGVAIQGTMVLINSGGAAGSGSGSSPDSPGTPKAPDAPAQPDIADDGTKFNKI